MFKSSFSPLYSFVGIQLSIYVRVYVGSVPLMYLFIFIPTPHSFDYCRFVMSLEIRWSIPPALFFFFKFIFVLHPFIFFVKFRISLPITTN